MVVEYRFGRPYKDFLQVLRQSKRPPIVDCYWPHRDLESIFETLAHLGLAEYLGLDMDNDPTYRIAPEYREMLIKALEEHERRAANPYTRERPTVWKLE